MKTLISDRRKHMIISLIKPDLGENGVNQFRVKKNENYEEIKK